MTALTLPQDLAALPMRPGRRRMLDALWAAGPDGVSMADLAEVYYGDEPRPARTMNSAACQVQRLRDLLAPLGWTLNSVGRGKAHAGRFVLARREVVAPAAVPVERPVNLAASFGIEVVTRTVGGSVISLPRSAFQERATA